MRPIRQEPVQALKDPPSKWNGFGKESHKVPPACPSLHRSQIFREFVSDAGSGSGIVRLRRIIPLLLN
jgi:hypothetical protein